MSTSNFFRDTLARSFLFHRFIENFLHLNNRFGKTSLKIQNYLDLDKAIGRNGYFV